MKDLKGEKMQPSMAAYYPNNVTTDHIQQVIFFLIYFGHSQEENGYITREKEHAIRKSSRMFYHILEGKYS
ncbi:hypothetical protein RHGRI_005691 [Rhododendron griersonianum]|uniref:Uncharacterized protein n=1 Tax=Rhododendron griersonianum TaxID=479676 RepID=A0AAV6LE73_9ERIC|nr:hypothetical protein RHGRI_005691 [Rhododendron griersonianum]